MATNIYEPVEAYKPKTGKSTDHPCQGSLSHVFSDETLEHYTHASDRNTEEPHIWNLASQCYRNLGVPDAVNPSITDQAIVITGESGAGKTFTTKQVLKFLAKVGSPGGESKLTDRMLATTAILEAWGNANMPRNPDSSRFGTFLNLS